MRRIFLRIILLLCLMGFSISVFPQSAYRSSNLGMGVGIDYGGFGGRYTMAPHSSFGLFAGLGYNLVGVGLNAGGSVYLAQNKRILPYALVMYGYNGVVKVTNKSSLNKIFYGPSAGLGFEIHSKTEILQKNFWNIELLIPFRERGFDEYLDDLEINHGVKYENKPLPVSFSIGYHFGF